MYATAFITAAVAAFAAGASASPYGSPSKTSSAPVSTSTCESSPPPEGSPYVSGFPLCSVAGFTEVPGCYTETIYQSSGATLEGCKDACLHNSTCKSYAYAEHYTECLFFDHVIEDIQLYKDDSSYFVHYDLCCTV